VAQVKIEVAAELEKIEKANKQDYLMEALLVEMRLANKNTEKMKEDADKQVKEHMEKVKQTVNEMDPMVKKFLGPFMPFMGAM